MNISLLWTLFWEFFKTGLFSVGGGLATVPFLYDMMEKYHWFSAEDLMNMIAVSEATPGPMGVNMATYVGYHATGGTILGGITTTVGLVLPSVIIICIIARFLKKFKDSKWVQAAFYGLRPAVTALIASAGLGVFVSAMFDQSVLAFSAISWTHVILFAILLAVSFFYKKLHPVALICMCAVIGIFLQL